MLFTVADRGVRKEVTGFPVSKGMCESLGRVLEPWCKSGGGEDSGGRHSLPNPLGA
jgi:hypothetical protein